MSSTTKENISELEPTAPISLAGEETPHPSHHLPDKPLVVIEPRGASVGLGDLWAYRELLYFLAWRDVKVRYKQTLLGVAWAVLQPVFMMVVFSLLFGRLAGIPSDGLPYPLFAFAGLLPWAFFASAVSKAGNSMVSNANLITKVYFPRLLVPVAAVTGALVDFALACGVLGVLMAYYGLGPSWGVLMLPALVLLLMLLAVATGTWAAALNVKYRDVGFILPFLIQLWFFASPIIYPVSLVTSKAGHPERWRLLMALNPLTGIVEGFRAALFGHMAFDWLALSVSAALTVALLVSGVLAFRRLEKGFADVI